MANFDFHSNLSPAQFERLVRDILEVRFTGIQFRTFTQGRDGGIDVHNITGTEKIICQTKLYQNHFNQLRTSLKKEVKKAKRLQPTQYIIATSCGLTPENVQEVLALFGGVPLSKENVWDRERLNQFLSQPDYKRVLGAHLNLFLTDLAVLESSLRGTIHNSVFQRSFHELETIKEEIRFYVPTECSQQASKQLLTDNILVLTGSAGTGKTTTAKILINNLLNSANDTIEFLKVHTVEEAEDVYDSGKHQLFFFDDYWGKFAEEVHEHHAGKRSRLPEFLTRIRSSNRHCAIITSRDYIIDHEDIRKQTALCELIDNYRLIINIPDFSLQERAHIFIRHLYHSDLNRDFLTRLYSHQVLDDLVRHSNFNPRLVSEFISKQFPELIKQDEDNNHKYNFYYHLKHHLDTPSLYWNGLIKAQTDSSRLLLFIIAISQNHESHEALRTTFHRCVPIALQNGFDVSVKDFKEAERLLEDGFIEVYRYESSGLFELSFKNGSIGDAVLHFLDTEGTEWIPILIKGAVFFDQLALSFTTVESTKENKSLKRLILRGSNKAVFTERLLNEIWTLHEDDSNLNKHDFRTQDDIVSRLYSLTRIFDLSANVAIREFLVSRVNTIIELTEQENGFPFSRSNISRLPALFKALKPWLRVDTAAFLNHLFFSIYFFEDYLAFLDFQEIYPEQFEKFIRTNKKNIKYQIDEVVLDSAELMDVEDFEVMMDMHYYEILEGLRLRHSKGIEEDLGCMGIRYFRNARQPVRRKRRKQKKDSDVRDFRHEHNKATKPYLKLLKQYVAEYATIDENHPGKDIAQLRAFNNDVLVQLLTLNTAANEEQLLTVLKAIALESYNDRKWYSVPELAKLFARNSGNNTAQEVDFSPAMQQQEKWWTLNSNYANYLTALYCTEDVSDKEYYKTLEDLLSKAPDNDSELMRILMQIDEQRFGMLFLKPYITNRLSKVDFGSLQTKVISFSEMMSWSFDVSFRSYRGQVREIFEEGSSCGGWLLEQIAAYLFNDETHLSCGDRMSFIIEDHKNEQPDVFNDFVRYCREKITPQQRRHFLTPEVCDSYEVELSKELSNPEFFNIAQRCGWIAEVQQLVNTLTAFVASDR